MGTDGTLNVFEQRPIWSRLAINLAFCFDLPEELDLNTVDKKLQDALETLIGSFPWIAGEVVTESRNAEGNSGVSKIVPGGESLRIITKKSSTDSISSQHAAAERMRLPCQYARRVRICAARCCRCHSALKETSTHGTSEHRA